MEIADFSSSPADNQNLRNCGTFNLVSAISVHD
jgi:hypothetical protein